MQFFAAGEETFETYDVDPGEMRRKRKIDRLPDSLKQVLATGRPVVRRGQAEMEAMGDGVDDIGTDVQVVVDFPFNVGTIA